MKPVSKTAFYCCGLRMRDAERAEPLCGDTYAARFMSDEGLAYFETFKDELDANAGNLVRHRLIDDLVREELKSDPGRQIFTIGAGFDTRPYRLDGGSWTEVDAPELIAYKDERLPVSEAKNALSRLTHDFDAQALADVLAESATTDPVLVVIEGVLLYVDVAATLELLDTLQGLFPTHRVICDLMTRDMFVKFAKSAHRRVAAGGAVMKVTERDPAGLFSRAGYKHRAKISIPEMGSRFGEGRRIPSLLLKTILRTLYKGYTVNVFDVGGYPT